MLRKLYSEVPHLRPIGGRTARESKRCNAGKSPTPPDKATWRTKARLVFSTTKGTLERLGERSQRVMTCAYCRLP